MGAILVSSDLPRLLINQLNRGGCEVSSKNTSVRCSTVSVQATPALVREEVA